MSVSEGIAGGSAGGTGGHLRGVGESHFRFALGECTHPAGFGAKRCCRSDVLGRDTSGLTHNLKPSHRMFYEKEKKKICLTKWAEVVCDHFSRCALQVAIRMCSFSNARKWLRGISMPHLWSALDHLIFKNTGVTR